MGEGGYISASVPLSEVLYPYYFFQHWSTAMKCFPSHKPYFHPGSLNVCGGHNCYISRTQCFDNFFYTCWHKYLIVKGSNSRIGGTFAKQKKRNL